MKHKKLITIMVTINLTCFLSLSYGKINTMKEVKKFDTLMAGNNNKEDWTPGNANESESFLHK